MFSRAPLRSLPRPPGKERGIIGGMPELILTMVVAGVVSLWLSGFIDQAMAVFSVAKDESESAKNGRLASVVLDYAASVSPTGSLPVPYSSGTTKYAIYDGADVNMQALLTEARISPKEANGDGNGQDYVRVYQVVSGLTSSVPLYGTTGPAVTLSYDQGVIYSTHCARADACNTTGTSGIPGSSVAFTSANLTTFSLGGDDYGLQRFSTLSIQRQKLSRTVETIDTIRTRLQELFREKQRIAAASDTSNFYPRQITTVAAAAVGTTTDCHNDGWFRLDNSDILKQIGLQPADSGVTAWGGQIQYCPDYDPLGTAGNDAPPHFAALRFLKNASTGQNPATGASHLTNNIVVSF